MSRHTRGAFFSAVLTLAVFSLAALPRWARALSPEQVFERASKSVVLVEVLDTAMRRIAFGSGVFVRERLVATNCHVAGDSQNLFRVVSKSSTWTATLVRVDRQNDVCLLTVLRAEAPPAELADARTLRPGQKVYSIGAPAGLELTIAEGLISSLRDMQGQTLVQTSAPISPGSSGGGLFDSEGRLVGITTFMLRGGQNLNFAISSSVVDGNLKETLGSDAPYAAPAAAVGTLLLGTRTGSLEVSPVRKFSDRDAKTAFDRWLREMSPRLKAYSDEELARSEFLKSVDYEATRAGLDRQLVLALVDELSQFRRYALNSGAIGFMQVARVWAHRIGDGDERSLFATQINLRYGCAILRQYIETAGGDLYAALEAYGDDSLGGSRHPRAAPRFADRVIGKWKQSWSYEANLK